MTGTGLVEELNKILDEFKEELDQDVDKAALATTKIAVKELKAKSPRSKRAKGGAYAESWSYRKEPMPFGHTSYTVYNRKHYRLTHLLENGHMIKNQYGSYGRTRPIPHIKPVELIAQDKFLEEIKKRI